MKFISRFAAGTPSTLVVLLLLGVAVLVLTAESIPISASEGEVRILRNHHRQQQQQPRLGKSKRTRMRKQRSRMVRRHRRGRKLGTTAKATATTVEEETPPLIGGYSLVPDFENNAVVMEAAAFAFRELLSSSSPYSVVSIVSKDDVVDFEILRVSQQVVAGLNIRMDLVFRDSSGGCVGAGTVVVYNHFGDLSITSWKTDESLQCEDNVAPVADNTTTSSSDTTTTTTTSDGDANNVVVLEDFSNPMHSWGEMNDPVMGGKSIGTFHIENGIGRFVGEVVDVPFLNAPGFIKGHTTDHNVFPDVASCQALQIIAKSNVDYAGYRISFGRAHAPGGKFFAFGYKASIHNLTSNFGTVTIPFSQFTDFWDDATGDPIHTCREDARFCPDEMTLKNLQLLELWGEGVGGVVDLEIQRIQAVGCNSDLI